MIVMNRRSRFAAALFALVALAFAQLVLPAQGCPRIADMNAMKHAIAAPDAASTNEMPCERHCVESVKSFDAVKPLVATIAPAIATCVRLVAVVALLPHRAARAVPQDATGPAPPFPRTTVLRI